MKNRLYEHHDTLHKFARTDPSICDKTLAIHAS